MRVLAILAMGAALAACAGGGSNFGSSLSPQTVSAPVRAAPTLTPAPRADSLIGLDAYGLREAFGSPEFQRNESHAEIWRYAGDGCTLFVYLYEDESDTMRTSFVEARAAAGGELPVDPCVAGVNRAHQLSSYRY
ncbi:hypothetical protein RHODOSMS8_03146 [Rhodobiaceae bacterium]|nr:hypothetical protein RHODOSMS8_03146 [Rhodobiaceae bacterium]